MKDVLSGMIPGRKQAGEKKPVVQQSVLSIDYPQAGEHVALGHYGIRISGCEGECQIAIDDSDWQNCRSDAGFCWHDWNPEQAGTHRISVRTRVGNKWVKAQRTCRVA